jgi:uncharacterized protein (DUF1330 family)
MTAFIEPTPEQIQTFATTEQEGPIVMLNLLSFREQAEYPEGSEHAPCTGREAYARYAVAVMPRLHAVGGHPVWQGRVNQTLIGPSESGVESWDAMLLVQYPSKQSFLQMAMDPEYLKVAAHRTAALADSRLVAMQAGAEL